MRDEAVSPESREINEPLSQMLDETQQISIRVLYEKLRLAVLDIAFAVPFGLDRAEDARVHCEKPIMKRYDVRDFDLQIDTSAIRRL